MHKIYFKKAFILFSIINTKIAKTIASFLAIKIRDFCKQNTFFYYNLSK